MCVYITVFSSPSLSSSVFVPHSQPDDPSVPPPTPMPTFCSSPAVTDVREVNWWWQPLNPVEESLNERGLWDGHWVQSNVFFCLVLAWHWSTRSLITIKQSKTHKLIIENNRTECTDIWMLAIWHCSDWYSKEHIKFWGERSLTSGHQVHPCVQCMLFCLAVYISVVGGGHPVKNYQHIFKRVLWVWIKNIKWFLCSISDSTKTTVALITMNND